MRSPLWGSDLETNLAILFGFFESDSDFSKRSGNNINLPGKQDLNSKIELALSEQSVDQVAERSVGSGDEALVNKLAKSSCGIHFIHITLCWF